VAGVTDAQVDDQTRAFLADAGFGGRRLEPLQQDASIRRYARLTDDTSVPVILMDSRQVDPGPFVRIAGLLTGVGLKAPRVLAGPADGLMIVEDLGQTDYPAWLALHPGDEAGLYLAAVEVLLVLHGVPAPDSLVALNPTRAAGMIAPFFDHAVQGLEARRRAAIVGALQDSLARHAADADCLSLRDFHAENLIWRPHQGGLHRVGLLDFQDAVRAPAAYDLVSLLRDVRRDVGQGTAAAAMTRFADGTGTTMAALLPAMAVIAVQRNLRIAGIFARLIGVEGKPKYRAFQPRLARLLAEDLAHPALADLARHLSGVLPA
jgi:N-acetylmuramate 1-kinase